MGCVSKKVMYYAADIAEIVKHDLEDYGFGKIPTPNFDWGLVFVFYIIKAFFIFNKNF